MQKFVLFVKKNLKIHIRGHCHYLGKYIGAANSICNLKYSVHKEIPIVFYK